MKLGYKTKLSNDLSCRDIIKVLKDGKLSYDMNAC